MWRGTGAGLNRQALVPEVKEARDGARELEHPSPSFDAALKALTDGIDRRDPSMLSFLGAYLD
jgi:hypothetical protein